MVEPVLKTQPSQNEVPAPVHTITLDGTDYRIYKDFYGRFQIYKWFEKDKTVVSIGRHHSYASVKEAWDALFVSRMQD